MIRHILRGGLVLMLALAVIVMFARKYRKE